MPVDLMHVSIAFLFALIWLLVIQIVVSERRRVISLRLEAGARRV